ncbi:hypothetical protein [Streptomyces puniciscabiei]
MSFFSARRTEHLAGVVSISLFALTGVLDQLPDVIDSARNVREA